MNDNMDENALKHFCMHAYDETASLELFTNRKQFSIDFFFLLFRLFVVLFHCLVCFIYIEIHLGIKRVCGRLSLVLCVLPLLVVSEKCKS